MIRHSKCLTLLKIDNIQNAISTASTAVNTGNQKTYASVVTGVDLGEEVDIDTLFTEQTLRNVKGKNVVISGFDFDSLKDGESVLSIVTGLIQEEDDSIKLINCKRLKIKHLKIH